MSTGDLLASVERALTEHYARSPVRASVSFVGVEPIEVLRYNLVPDERVYVSLGMSRHVMVAAAHPTVQRGAPRAELMLRLRGAGYRDVWRQLAVLAATPTVEGAVITDGMTLDLGRPLATGATCSGCLIGIAPIEVVATTAGPVLVLQVLPATATELAWARVHGCAALRQRWSATRTDLLDLGRRAVSLR